MSIATQIQALTTDRDNIRQTLLNKGASVSDHGFDDFAQDIANLTSTVNNQDKTVTENGTYTADEGYTGLGTVTVNVQGGGGGGIAAVSLQQSGYSATEETSINDTLSAKNISDSAYTKQKYDEWDPSSTSARNLYKEDKQLVYAPKIDTSNVTDMDRMFDRCIKLTSIPLLDTSKVTNMGTMFSGCSDLTSIPLLDTSKVTVLDFLLENCISITTIPQLDTSNATGMRNMFEGCTSLTSIPLLDTSKVTNMGTMFSNCTSLTNIPLLDTSNVTTMQKMFYNCDSLTSIPQLNTSNVTNMGDMFNSCDSLTSIPQLNTSKVTNMQGMFYNCYGLQSIPELDCSSLSYDSYNFCYSWISLNNLTSLGGFTNIKCSFQLQWCPKVTVESLVNVLNGLYDFTSAGETPGNNQGTLTLGNENFAKLSPDQIATATAKGWTVTA